MTDRNLFNLLDIDPNNDEDRQRVDADAIIKEARQNPHELDLMYSFAHSSVYLTKIDRCCPLHQAIVLGLSVEVIHSLSTLKAIKQKCSGTTALHLACQCGASIDVVSLLISTWPEAVKEKKRNGQIPLQVACEFGASLDVVRALLITWPDAAKEKPFSGFTPLHFACYGRASLDVIQALLNTWPDATKEKDLHGETPLTLACKYGASLDVIRALLSTWPDAAKVNNDWGRSPLYFACQHRASIDVIREVLNAWPDAAREKDICGDIPLHRARYRTASTDVIRLLLSSWPDGAREENNTSSTPLHFACFFRASLDVVQLLLDHWLEAAENRNSQSVQSLVDESRLNPDIQNFLVRVAALFNENQNEFSPDEIMIFFININWWNGALLAINRYPTVAKSLGLHTKVMADFLSVVGKCCSLTTMLKVIENEPDLLEGV